MNDLHEVLVFDRRPGRGAAPFRPGWMEEDHEEGRDRNPPSGSPSGSPSAPSAPAAEARPAPPPAFSPAPPPALSREERDRIVLESLPMVALLARRLRDRLPPHVEVGDMVSAGTLGLFDAALKFDPSKGIRFSSYAQFRIRGAMLDHLRNSDWAPRGVRPEARRVARAVEELVREHAREPEPEEIAARLGIGVAAFHAFAAELDGTLMARPRVVEEGTVDPLDAVPAGGDDPEEAAVKRSLLGRLRSLRAELSPRHRLVLEMRYDDEMTAVEMAAALGVAPSRVSQILADAHRSLRELFEAAPRTPAEAPPRTPSRTPSRSPERASERASVRAPRKARSGAPKGFGPPRLIQGPVSGSRIPGPGASGRQQAFPSARSIF